MKRVIADVLAERYVSSAMAAIWSPERKVAIERRFWVADLKAKRDLGRPIAEEAIAAYERAVDRVDLASITGREARLRQDVKARIEEFNALAGGLQLIHAGFTSRDLTDNIEQFQMLEATTLLRDRSVAVLRRLAEHAEKYADLNLCARTHNVPAQTTTLGKRFANVAEEMLIAFNRLEHLIARYPLRGIKGAVGTMQDMADLLESPERALELEQRLVEHMGFSRVLESVGQVYPRSLDFEVLAIFNQLASGPGNLAKTIRLMAGHGLLHEGFGQEQTGSTAMPHKMNTRTCERVSGFVAVLGGFLAMIHHLLGDQWNEGDVSCSVVRRVALPGSCFALDGLYEAIMTVLDEMEVFPAAIEQELRRHLPFLSSTRLLMAAVKHGLGRETAHRIIKSHALAAIRAGAPETFVERLADDSDLSLPRETIEATVAEPEHGLATMQVRRVCDLVAAIAAKYPEAAAYVPEAIR